MGACIARASILAGDIGALSLAGTLFISCDEHQTQDADDRYLRRGDVSNRRRADVADRGFGRLNWADSVLTVAASGTTEVRAKAVVPCQASK
jgi:hypothetical protein